MKKNDLIITAVIALLVLNLVCAMPQGKGKITGQIMVEVYHEGKLFDVVPAKDTYIFVYNSGTTDLANIYYENGTQIDQKRNALMTDSEGRFEVIADSGKYDIYYVTWR